MFCREMKKIEGKRNFLFYSVEAHKSIAKWRKAKSKARTLLSVGFLNEDSLHLLAQID